LNAITSAKVRTGEATRSFKYVFKDILNSASNAIASPLPVKFKIALMLAISKWSTITEPPCLHLKIKLVLHNLIFDKKKILKLMVRIFFITLVFEDGTQKLDSLLYWQNPRMDSLLFQVSSLSIHKA